MSHSQKSALIALLLGLSSVSAAFGQGYQPQNYAQSSQWGAAPGLAAPQGQMPNGVPGLANPQAGFNGLPGQTVRPMLPVLPGGTGSNAAPGQFDPNMWQNLMKDRINAGTVLTGTMEETISSKKSKIGDVFGIVLSQGYTDQNGLLQLPVGSRIVGSVSKVVPAKYQRNGMPGTMDISLQSLVLPDGRTGAFYGMIQYDPNQNLKKDPNSSTKSYRNSIPFGTYASSVGSSGLGLVTSATRIVGWRYSPRQHMTGGKDLTINKDENIAVKLTRPVELAKFSNPAAALNPDGSQQQQAPGFANQASNAGGSVPYQPYQGANQLQGMKAPSEGSLNEPF
jgi:hypothetical protein